MATIKYTGLAHFRELLAEDFTKLGAEGQKALTFARHEVTKVKDEVAAVLLKTLGDEFEEVKEDVATETSKPAKASPSGPTASSGA